MVRKTKEDAEITRQRIINAAREVFLNKGVSKTSLEQVASHAGVTRGAVYWHFKNKSELFHAMREQIFLPLIDRMDDLLLSDNVLPGQNNDPLKRLEASMQHTIDMLTNHIETQQTFIVMMSKCEYVDEFAVVLQEILNNCSDIEAKYERIYTLAQQQNIAISTLSPAELAVDSHLFFGGLLHMWVKDSEGKRFREHANALISAHIRLRRKN